MKLDDYYRNPEQYMNVFYLGDDPVVAARECDDKSVKLGIVFACQILSNVWFAQPEGSALSLDWSPNEPALYGTLTCLVATLGGGRVLHPRHDEHPSVTWAALYGGNYDWLYRHGMALLDEFTYRFGRIHAHQEILRTLELVPPSLVESMETWCDAPAVLPSEYVQEDIVQSYRTYFRKGKAGLLVYTKRTAPSWIADVSHHRE